MGRFIGVVESLGRWRFHKLEAMFEMLYAEFIWDFDAGPAWMVVEFRIL